MDRAAKRSASAESPDSAVRGLLFSCLAVVTILAAMYFSCWLIDYVGYVWACFGLFAIATIPLGIWMWIDGGTSTKVVRRSWRWSVAGVVGLWSIYSLLSLIAAQRAMAC